MEDSDCEADANFSSDCSINFKQKLKIDKSLSECDLDVSDLEKNKFEKDSLGDGQKSEAGVESINITDENIKINTVTSPKISDDINKKEMPLENCFIIDDLMPRAEKLI